MNWNFILTAVVFLAVLVLTLPVFLVMMLGYTKAKLNMYVELADKHHTQFHPSAFDTDEFDWSIFEGESK